MLSSKKRIFRALIVLAIGGISPVAHSATPLESKIAEVKKTYSNGDYVRMACATEPHRPCKLDVSLDGKKKTFKIDFHQKGIAPSFDYIRMTGTRSPFFISITAGYKCRSEEDALMKEPIVGAFCRVAFSVNADGEVFWSGIEVIPTEESIYLDL